MANLNPMRTRGSTAGVTTPTRSGFYIRGLGEVIAAPQMAAARALTTRGSTLPQGPRGGTRDGSTTRGRVEPPKILT